MILYSGQTINDWYNGATNIIKVYRDDAVCYYKISGTEPTAQTPCFAVVVDITQYTSTEFEDVFNEADGKWYKLNNLNVYEEYGIYGSGRTECESQTATTCSATCIERTSTYNGYIPLGETFTDGTVIDIDFQMTEANGGVVIGDYGTNDSNDWRVFVNYYGRINNLLVYDFDNTRQTYNTGNWSQRFHLEIGNYYIKDVDSGNYLINATPKTSFTRPNQMYLFHMEGSFISSFIDYGKVYSLKIYKNNTLVKDFIPWSDCKGNFGLFDKVSSSVTQSVGSMSGETTVVEQCTTTYEGKLTLDDGYEYEYSGDTWVNVGEVSGGTSLPSKPFVLNYNAKNYDAATHSIPYTNGQSKQVNAVQNYGSNTIVDHSEDGYISITGDTRLTVSGGTTSLSRTNTQAGCSMTIVSKARTGTFYSIITNRGSYSDINWMWRYPTNGIFLHGSNSYNKVTYYTTTSASPIVASVRVSWNGSSVQQQINDWTNNGSYSGAFQYGSTSDSGALFCDYLKENAEFWRGDFYWVYLSQEVLTDEEIQQVIAYNEEGGVGPIYPVTYDEKDDPPDNVTFTSMTEANSYECPWVGMHATINGDNYIFSAVTSGYAWVEWTLPYDSEVAYLENDGTQYINTNLYLNTSNFEVGCEIVGDYCIWGYCHQNVANGTWLGVQCTSASKTAFYGKCGNSYKVDIASYMNSTANTIVYKQNGVTVNGTTLPKSITMGSDSIANQPLLFYARYDFYKQGVETYSYPQKYKSFYIKNNNELVIDLIAVRVGTVGYFYDRVSGQLFNNSGSGSFIVGQDI